MILRKSSDERRKEPRLNNVVPLKIFHDDGDIVSKTANISRSGVYCQVNKYIEPMTKLKINLLLPVKKNGKTISKKVTCQGAVVRVEPAAVPNEYNIAIFFNDISSRDAESISNYVSALLEL